MIIIVFRISFWINAHIPLFNSLKPHLKFLLFSYSHIHRLTLPTLSLEFTKEVYIHWWSIYSCTQLPSEMHFHEMNLFLSIADCLNSIFITSTLVSDLCWNSHYNIINIPIGAGNRNIVYHLQWTVVPCVFLPNYLICQHVKFLQKVLASILL